MSTTTQTFLERLYGQIFAARRDVHEYEIFARDALDPGQRAHMRELAGRRSDAALRILNSEPALMQETRRSLLLNAELAARNARGRLLDELRADAPTRGQIGGEDRPVVVLEEGESKNGVLYDAESLEVLRAAFEGAAFVVRLDRHGLGSHLSESCRPWPTPGDGHAEAGFVHHLRVTEQDGRRALSGVLHVFEDAGEVRRLVEGHVGQGKAGLSISTPGTSEEIDEHMTRAQKVEESRGKKRPVRGVAQIGGRPGAEQFCTVAFTQFPAAGGRVLPGRALRESITVRSAG